MLSRWGQLLVDGVHEATDDVKFRSHWSLLIHSCVGNIVELLDAVGSLMGRELMLN